MSRRKAVDPFAGLRDLLPARVTVYWGDAWGSHDDAGDKKGQDQAVRRAWTGHLYGISTEVYQMAADIMSVMDDGQRRKICEVGGVPLGWVSKIEVLGVTETFDFSVTVSAKRRKAAKG